MVEKTADDPGWGPVAALVALLVAFGWFGVSMASGDDGDRPPVPDVGVAEHEAWGACKEAVEDQMRNPASVDFSVLASVDGIAQPGGGFNFDGALSAENDFGVEKSLAFSCEVSADGIASAKVRQAR